MRMFATVRDLGKNGSQSGTLVRMVPSRDPGEKGAVVYSSTGKVIILAKDARMRAANQQDSYTYMETRQL